MSYTKDERLEELIQGAVASIEAGKPAVGLTAMIKSSPTYILLASSTHAESRYQPGSKLTTYVGVDVSGTAIKETWGGGVAEIKSDSVILRNAAPIVYPQGHPLADEPVRGTYQSDGSFMVEQKTGSAVLYNEYVSDVAFVKGAYGIQATEKLQTGLKLQPSYVLQIPKEYGSVAIMTKSGVEISLTGGDYVVIDSKKDKVTSVHGCEKDWLAKTYVSLESHMSGLSKM